MAPPSRLSTDDTRDGELFVAVASGGRRARDAQEQLYQRHVRFLYGALTKQRDSVLNLAGLSVEDLVQDTFQRAFERAGTFVDDPTHDADRSRRRARAWLGRIASRLVADSFRRFREVSASDYLERLPETAAEDVPPSSPRVRQLRAVMESLTEREQDVLRVTALYHKVDGSNRLPNEVSSRLGERWGISNQNVRAIRSRALKKLRKAMGESEGER